MKDLKYSDLIKKNKDLEHFTHSQYTIAILSNIMVHQTKEICEYFLRTEGINATVSLGDYDNIVQDTMKFSSSNAIIIFWEIYNFTDGLQYKIDLLSDKEIDQLLEKIKHEINLVFQNLKNTPIVLMNKFSSLIFNQYSLEQQKLEKLTKILNEYIEHNLPKNFKLIDIDKVISKVSIKKAVDLRYYYSSKTLYSIEFYKEYFNYIKPIFVFLNGKVKKALIFDCDNTLWKGILGEDGFANIKMFKEVQHLAVALAKKGVIIGLCSKNNPEDVDEVLKNHKEMILKDDNIVIKMVNWENKASNLKTIAKELNIGLDSIVFIDDSNFEVNLIKEELPIVKVLQVPSREYEYSIMLREISNLFYNPSQTKEDLEKIQMYKAQIQRSQEEQEIGNIEDYLQSLELQITTYTDYDEENHIARLSQMTQKTNQFNVTTKRYTEQDIKNFTEDANKIVLAIGVNDKFGDNGIVGLAILKIKDTNAIIDTLLMSCRVLGRNIEYRFMDIIINILKSRNIISIYGEYYKTLKNEQVANLYDRYGFNVLEKNSATHQYLIKLKDYKYKKLNYIGVKNGN